MSDPTNSISPHNLNPLTPTPLKAGKEKNESPLNEIEKTTHTVVSKALEQFQDSSFGIQKPLENRKVSREQNLDIQELELDEVEGDDSFFFELDDTAKTTSFSNFQKVDEEAISPLNNTLSEISETQETSNVKNTSERRLVPQELTAIRTLFATFQANTNCHTNLTRYIGQNTIIFNDGANEQVKISAQAIDQAKNMFSRDIFNHIEDYIFKHPTNGKMYALVDDDLFEITNQNNSSLELNPKLKFSELGKDKQQEILEKISEGDLGLLDLQLIEDQVFSKSSELITDYLILSGIEIESNTKQNEHIDHKLEHKPIDTHSDLSKATLTKKSSGKTLSKDHLQENFIAIATSKSAKDNAKDFQKTLQKERAENEKRFQEEIKESEKIKDREMKQKLKEDLKRQNHQQEIANSFYKSRSLPRIKKSP